MKKIISVLLIVVIIAALVGCSKEETIGFKVKVATNMDDEGWLYYLYNEVYSGDDGDSSTQFGAYNLKYKTIEGFQIPIKDSNTGEIVDYSQSSLPYLHISPDTELKNELDTLNKYLNEIEHTRTLNEKDFSNLNLKLLDLSNIVELYNKMLGAEEEPDGSYEHLPEANIEQESLIDGYQWQVGYYISYGNIKCVRIDLLIDGSDYLSDLYANGKATQEQKDLYERILLIEKDIIDNQNFTVSIVSNTTEQYSLKRLVNILKKIQKPIDEE